MKSLMQCSALGCLILTAATTLAQTDTSAVTSVIDEQAAVELAARSSQTQIAALDEQAGRLLTEYRQKAAEAESLKGYNTQMETQVASQLVEMRSIEQQFTEIETTSREVVPLMQRMLATLEQFVALDMPFLPAERQARIATLHEIMGRADVSASEKYRRILEAYNVEMEYGRTLESYRAQLDDNGESLTVDFLRMGRVALMYQSLDGARTGYWDSTGKRFVVDNTYQRSVRQGLRIAKQQAAPDLMIMPVASPRGN